MPAAAAAAGTVPDHPEVGVEPLATKLRHAFESSRLSYRSVEASDTDFLFRLKGEPEVALNSTARWPRPITRDGADAYRKALQGHLMAVIIELDASQEPGAATGTSQPARRIPIGTVALSACLAPEITQCRTAALAIDILSEYQGRGYGSEATRWILDWGFEMAGLHRVRMGCFSYNTRAIRAYEAVGFERDGVEREAVWMGGRYWDLIIFGMLDRDWARVKAERRAGDSSTR